MNFEWEPIVRMTSTYIEGGRDSFDEILKKAGDGALYLDGANHGTGGSTFTIAPSKAYRIKDGKLSEPLKVALISGSVFETLNNIEAVGSDFTLWNSAFGGCGKMSQMPLPVADGGPTILVKGMTVS
jgi:TldD protein